MKNYLSMSFMFLSAITFSQEASDIYLYDVKWSDKDISIFDGRNISKHQGYDNQPSFHPSLPIIYYSSFDDDGRSDIKSYDFKSMKTRRFTKTRDREYSPTVTPDGKFISCIIQRDNDAQDLGKYPIGGGDPTTLIDNLIVGYHAWVNESQLILFVLGDEMTLRWYDLKTGKDRVIAKKVGRSLHRIPEAEAMSFVHKLSDDKWIIKRLDIQTQETADITTTIKGCEDMTWTRDGRILMSDGGRIFVFDPNSQQDENSQQPSGWKPIRMGGTKLSGITRLALSRDGNRLAVVVQE